jgi:hypothetical protein
VSILNSYSAEWQVPGDELRWVRRAAEEDTVAIGSQRGMVVCISCDNNKVFYFYHFIQISWNCTETRQIPQHVGT